MITALRSIDNLLNRFDELSKCHESLLSNFETNFSDIRNPLRNVLRTEEEQEKTTANILVDISENNDQLRSIATLEDFHRHIIKTRYLHRPPSYSSNNSSLINRVSSRTSLKSVESISLPKISQITSKTNASQPKPPSSKKNISEPKVNLIRKIKPNVLREDSFTPRRFAHPTITAFTMETVNRLSKPKTYNRLLDDKSSMQRLKPYENMKKEASKYSTLPPIKRTKPITIKPSSKKLKVEKKVPLQTPRRNPVTSVSRPLLFIAPAPTVFLTFPIQSQQSSSQKLITPHKRSMLYLKT